MKSRVRGTSHIPERYRKLFYCSGQFLKQMEKESPFQTYTPEELRSEPLRALRDLYSQEAGSFLPWFQPRLSGKLSDQRIAEAESKFIELFQEAREKMDHPAIGRVLEIAQSEKWTRDNAQDLLGKVRSELWEDLQ